MLRFILVAIFLLLYFLLGIPVLGILWLIGKVNKRSADLAALRIVQWGFKVILKISGVEVTVIGEDRVPDEPVLYVGNHRSYFDIFLPFHAGSFKIAEKSGCPIVPVALNNTINIFEGHLPYIRKTHVVLEYCPPVYINEMEKEDRKKIDVYCQKIIKDTIEKNHTLV